MKSHAASQISDVEATRLVLATLASGRSPAVSLVRATEVGNQEMLGHWVVDTDEGPVHFIRLVRLLDGEPVGFDHAYRDETDATAVWQHLVDEARRPDDVESV